MTSTSSTAATIWDPATGISVSWTVPARFPACRRVCRHARTIYGSWSSAGIASPDGAPTRTSIGRGLMTPIAAAWIPSRKPEARGGTAVALVALSDGGAIVAGGFSTSGAWRASRRWSASSPASANRCVLSSSSPVSGRSGGRDPAVPTDVSLLPAPSQVDSEVVRRGSASTSSPPRTIGSRVVLRAASPKLESSRGSGSCPERRGEAAYTPC